MQSGWVTLCPIGTTPAECDVMRCSPRLHPPARAPLARCRPRPDLPVLLAGAAQRSGHSRSG